MQLALRTSRAFPLGLGAVDGGVTYTDTGDGITPSNFQSNCCGSPLALTTDSCAAFFQANYGKFGSAPPCSDGGLQNLLFPSPAAGGVIPPPPPPSAYVPQFGVTIPVDARFPECNGKTITTATEADQLLTCQSKISNAAQQAQVRQTISATAAELCAAKKVECANNWFQTKVSADCSTCLWDLSNPVVIAAGLAAFFALLLLVKR